MYQARDIVLQGTIKLGTRGLRTFVREHIILGRSVTPPLNGLWHDGASHLNFSPRQISIPPTLRCLEKNFDIQIGCCETYSKSKSPIVQLFGTQMALALLVAISGHQSFNFQDPPIPMALVIDLLVSKPLCTGPYKS